MKNIKSFEMFDNNDINEGVFGFFRRDNTINKDEISNHPNIGDAESWKHYTRCVSFVISHVNEHNIPSNKKESVVGAIASWVKRLSEEYSAHITDSTISKEYKLWLSPTKLGL